MPGATVTLRRLRNVNPVPQVGEAGGKAGAVRATVRLRVTLCARQRAANHQIGGDITPPADTPPGAYRPCFTAAVTLPSLRSPATNAYAVRHDAVEKFESSECF